MHRDGGFQPDCIWMDPWATPKVPILICAAPATKFPRRASLNAHAAPHVQQPMETCGAAGSLAQFTFTAINPSATGAWQGRMPCEGEYGPVPDSPVRESQGWLCGQAWEKAANLIGRRHFDGDLPRCGFSRLRNHDLQAAVLALGADALGIGGLGEREAAQEAAGVALGAGPPRPSPRGSLLYARR